MEQLKKAIQLLVKAGKLVHENAFDLLKETPDPEKVAILFLENYPNKSDFTKDDFMSILKSGRRKVIPKSNDAPIIVSKGKIPRRHISKRKKIESIDDRINTQTKTKKEINMGEMKFNGGTIISHATVLRTQFSDLQGLQNYETDLKIVKDPQISENYKGNVENVIGYFRSRFDKLSALFRNRVDIPNLTSIKGLRFLKDSEQVSVIGMISDKYFSASGSGSLSIEDPIADEIVHVIIPKNDKTLIEKCMQLMNDTVVCIIGFQKSNELIAKEVILPDIPNLRKTNRAEVPVHGAFLSDIHVGSKNFLEKPMNNFIDFLNGKYGNKKMRALGEQTKYVMFGGDVVDGVGIYVNHLDDLKIDDISEQYNLFADYVEKIPEDVEIVIIPGNHDMVRSAEPQPRIEPHHAPTLERMPNVHMLSNPSQVALNSVQVLLYHCTSLPDIMNSIPGVPNDKPVEVMKHMLKARHLAPIWGSKTPIAPEPEDHLVIDKIPDIFHGGHIHINGDGFYKGVQIINSGTMQNQTGFQRSLNIIPTPGQINITNLKTLEVNRINFLF